jgi:anti-sigma factor ChrR (cupin superfamily)
MTAHEQVNDELREQAALYALGLLEPEEARLFAQHLAEGCAVCENEVRTFEAASSLIPLSLRERKPALQLRERLMERIRPARKEGPQVWKQWQAPPAQAGPVHVVHAGEGGWQPVTAGVTAKQLYVDAALDYVTMLVRMAPGSTYPAHRHGGPEQCFVLEGDLRVGPIVLHAGDYQCAPRDSIHEITSTEQGCLLLIVSSQNDELLPGRKSDPR